MIRHRPRILLRPLRPRIFAGCEGASEVGYLARVGQIAEQCGSRVFLDWVDLHGGNPLTMVENAAKIVQRRARDRGDYSGRFVLLDADRCAVLTAAQLARLQKTAAESGLSLIWQDPCHEAFLLRHLPGYRWHQPVDSAAAKAALTQQWPGYSRPMSAAALRNRIDEAALKQAGQMHADLEKLLKLIGF